MSILLLLPLFSLLCSSAYVPKAGVNWFAGVSCGFNDCTTNVTGAEATYWNCYSSCNPCVPGECQYQYYTFNATSGVTSQYLFGDDSTCGNASPSNPPPGAPFVTYTCGVCNKDLFATANISVIVTCPILVEFKATSDCNNSDCSVNTEVISSASNKCVKSCNPCGSGSNDSCQYHTFQSDGGSKIYQYVYGDDACSPATVSTTNIYECGLCNSSLRPFGGPAITFSCLTSTPDGDYDAVKNVIVTSAVVNAVNSDSALTSLGVAMAPIPETDVVRTGDTITIAISVTLPSSGTLTLAQQTSISNVLIAQMAASYQISPSSRIKINFTPTTKRAVSSVTVVIDAPNSNNRIQYSFILFSLFLLSFIF